MPGHRQKWYAPRKQAARLLIAASAIAMIQPLSAMAQPVNAPLLDSPIPLDVKEGQLITVLERPRPEFDPIGAQIGGFTLLPRVQVGTAYTSNVFGASTNVTGDGILVVDPSFTLRSNWTRNALSITGGLTLRRYFSESIRNENGYNIGARTRLDMTPDFSIVAEAEHRQGYEPQFQSDSPSNARSVIRYQRTGALVRAAYTSGRMRLTGALDLEALSYANVVLTSGATFAQRFRNRIEPRLSARMEYAALPEGSVFIEANTRGHDFTDAFIAPGVPNRNGQDYRVVAGVATKISTLVRAWVGIGYIKRNFDSNIYPSVSGAAYDAKITLLPSGLTTVTLRAKRDILDSATIGSGFIADTAQMRVDHELLRNLLLFGEGQYQHSEFRGLVRTDNIWQAQSGATYLANRHLTISAALSFVRRTSSVTTVQPYTDWRGVLAANIAL